MALSVIGSGFGRTGTRTLKSALEMIGFGPCHHMEEVLPKIEQVRMWQRVADKRTVDWDVLFEGFNAQVDWPGAHVWRELASYYPNAKVVHSVRPEDSWWKSFSGTIAKYMTIHEELPGPPYKHEMSEMVLSLIARQTFNGNFLDRETALAAYRQREADVRAAIPPERLLVFDVAEGWEPLCDFLGVAVPEAPFPRTNSRDEFWAHFGGEPA